MTRTLADPESPAHGPWPNTLHRRPFVDVDAVDEKLVGIHVVIVLGVGHGGADHLADDLRRIPGRKVQHRAGVDNLLAAYLISDQPHLARRTADISGRGNRG